MRYIIFGAGKTGEKALSFLGPKRVKYFADNDKSKKQYCGKKVIDFDTLSQMGLSGIIVVIASKMYWQEIERSLLSINIIKYFVFQETDPQVWNKMAPKILLNRQWEVVSYNRILANKKLKRFKKIAILGENRLLPYLVSEIAFQGNFKSIFEIISYGKNVADSIMGIPVYTWENADKSFDCLIVNVGRKRPGLSNILDNLSEDTGLINIYDAEYGESIFYHPELLKFKDIHRGKRIFIIGNGPSMNLQDLDKLHEHQEICIACNKIYRIYDKTAWRPDYLVMADPLVIEESKEDIPNLSGNIILADSCIWADKIPCFESVYYVHLIDRCYDNNGYTKFSEDICKGTYCGGNVVYAIGLQLAAYMGASEIYLIGVDNTYTENVTDDKNHFIQGYFSADERKKYEGIKRKLIDQEKINKAYEKAECYSRKKGFRIYNATRGGALEAFERVEFDELFRR